VGIHGSGEHPLELELPDLLLEPPGVPLDLDDGARLAFRLGEREQLERAVNAVVYPLQAARQRLQLRALATERLRRIGRVPDLRILEFAAYFGKPLGLAVVLKDTPSRRRGVPRGP
jgi:hypothetical protein